MTIGSFSKPYRRWLLRFAVGLLFYVAVATAQSSVPAQSGSVYATSSADSSSPNTSSSPQKTQEQAPRVGAKPGNVAGTTLDQSGSVAVGAVVRLTSEDKSFVQEIVSGDNGQFSFSNVPRSLHPFDQLHRIW